MLEVDTNRSALVVVRHGDSTYKDRNDQSSRPDLTPEGVKQIQSTALDLETVIKSYPNLFVFSPDVPRHKESAAELLKTWGLAREIIIEEDLRPFDLYDKDGFLKYSTANSTSRYGQMWLRDPLFDSRRNPFTERRFNVNHRAYRFLIRRMENLYIGEGLCDVAVTSFEIMTNYLKAMFEHIDGFPIEVEEAPKNGEAMILQPDSYDPRLITVTARDTQIEVRFDPVTKIFERVA